MFLILSNDMIVVFKEKQAFMSSSVNFTWLLTFWVVRCERWSLPWLSVNFIWNHPWPFLTHITSSWVHLKTFNSMKYMSRPLKSPKKVCGGGWVVKTKNRVLLRSTSLSFEFSKLDFSWLWPSSPSPDPWPELDNSILFYLSREGMRMLLPSLKAVNHTSNRHHTPYL